jgi:hypothetical protein
MNKFWREKIREKIKDERDRNKVTLTFPQKS